MASTKKDVNQLENSKTQTGPKEKQPPPVQPKISTTANQGVKNKPVLEKKDVPSDNSCLFASIYYLVNGK